MTFDHPTILKVLKHDDWQISKYKQLAMLPTFQAKVNTFAEFFKNYDYIITCAKPHLTEYEFFLLNHHKTSICSIIFEMFQALT